MTETISLEVNLRAYVRRDTARRWIATCPLIAVASQGKTADEARTSLQEAVELWFESCIERGVLDQALREASFRPSLQRESVRKRTTRGAKQRHRAEVLGDEFAVRLTIPGYEAQPVLGAIA
ncbi:MAG TPA: type II toxin-antitoxin system HicB family antitoxin [Thermoanaerobaculia bacterium]|nr:type II toxin-antitoxin system HicB family antitoxin [Thermoanaerobaculia bacterium]